MTTEFPLHRIELRLYHLTQLFNSMDPTPFHSKALDRDAEAFIETWAQGLPLRSRLALTIHLETLPPEPDPAALLSEAIHNHFGDKATLTRRSLNLLFRQGRLSLLIGILFVTLCLFLADIIAQQGSGTAITIARESLTIVGWVAMWRPLQIFLYDWWPLARSIRVYRMLQAARVSVVAAVPQEVSATSAAPT